MAGFAFLHLRRQCCLFGHLTEETALAPQVAGPAFVLRWCRDLWLDNSRNVSQYMWCQLYVAPAPTGSPATCASSTQIRKVTCLFFMLLLILAEFRSYVFVNSTCCVRLAGASCVFFPTSMRNSWRKDCWVGDDDRASGFECPFFQTMFIGGVGSHCARGSDLRTSAEVGLTRLWRRQEKPALWISRETSVSRVASRQCVEKYVPVLFGVARRAQLSVALRALLDGCDQCLVHCSCGTRVILTGAVLLWGEAVESNHVGNAQHCHPRHPPSPPPPPPPTHINTHTHINPPLSPPAQHDHLLGLYHLSRVCEDESMLARRTPSVTAGAVSVLLIFQSRTGRRRASLNSADLGLVGVQINLTFSSSAFLPVARRWLLGCSVACPVACKCGFRNSERLLGTWQGRGDRSVFVTSHRPVHCSRALCCHSGSSYCVTSVSCRTGVWFSFTHRPPQFTFLISGPTAYEVPF